MSELKHSMRHAQRGAIGISAPSGPTMMQKLFAKRSVKPGEHFGAPGQGSAAGIATGTVIVLLLLWVVVSNSGLVKPIFLPTPQAVFAKFILVSTEGFAGATLLEHTLTSLYRVFGAFALACVTAIPIGVLMGVSRVARGIFDPPIEFYRPLPPLAYLPMVIIWFGIGEFSKVYLIFLAIFAPMAIAARSGVRSVSIEQIHAAYSMGATRLQVIWHVILKSALPEIFTGMRIGIGVGWTTLVAGEMVASTQGLGFMVLNAAEFLASDVVIMGIIVIGLFAFVFDLLMRHLEKVLVPWKGKV
ncbi:MAG: ABC transporter permease subunit [Proteobacteria bacterium]|nr:ABC transporter permease subunit [Pseudomonadota bacterium]